MAGASAILSAKRRALFLDALSECGNVSLAAKTAGFTWQRAYQLRAERPEFATAWDEALEQAADRLEQEAWRRATEGVEKYVTSAKGLVYDDEGAPVMERAYSDTLLIFLLKGARPQKYRDNVNVTAQAQHLGITVILEQMRDDRTVAESAAEFVALVDAVGEAQG